MQPITIQQASWAGNYPLNFNTVIDTTGVTGAVIFYSGTAVPSFVPNVSVGGKAATYLGRISGENTTGTIYAWKIIDPPQGMNTAVRVWMDNQYGDPMRFTFVGFDNATDFGFFDAKNVPNANSQTPLVLQGITEKSGGCVLALGAGHYNQIRLGASTPAGSTSLLNDATLNGHQIILSKLDYSGLGQTIQMRYLADYNTINGVAIEVAGSSGPPKATLNIPSITNASAIGNHLVKDPNVTILAPAGIAAETSALGSPTVIKTIVAYYDLNGTGNVATGTPATTVERTSQGSNYRNSRAAVPVVNGERKYYEVTVDNITLDSIPAIGIGIATVPLDTQLGGWQSDAISWDASGGARDNNTGMNGRPTMVKGDILMVAVDMTNGWVFMGKNGQWYNGTQAGNVNFSSGDGRVNNTQRPINNPLHPYVQTQNIGDKFTTNFGRSPFAYTPPAGFTGIDTAGPARRSLLAPSITTDAPAFGTHQVANANVVLMPPSVVNASELGAHSVIALLKSSALVNVSVLGNHYVRPVLAPAGILNASLLGSPKVGHVLRPTGILNSSLLGSVRLILRLDVPGIGETAATGTPSVQTSYALRPSGVSNTSEIGEPSIKTSNQIEAPSLVNASEVGQHSLTSVVSVASYVNVSAFGTHVLNQRVKAEGLANVSEIGSPVVAPGKVEVAPAGISTESYLGNPVLHYVVNVAGIINEQQFGNTFVTHIYEDAGVYPPSIINLSVMGSHRFNHRVHGTGIAPTNPVFGSHLVADVPKLGVPGIENVSAFGAHGVWLTLRPTGIANQSEVGQTAVRYRVNIAGISNDNLLSNPSLKASYTLIVSGIQNTSAFGTGEVRFPTVKVEVPGIEPTVALGDPRLSQIVRLAGIPNLSETGTPSVRSGIIRLLPDGIINRDYLGNPSVTTMAGTDKFTRVDGEWVPVEALLVKYDGQWMEFAMLFEKKNGVWERIM